jgi:hypothetical protein
MIARLAFRHRLSGSSVDPAGWFSWNPKENSEECTAQRFRAEGVSETLIERLQNWGIAYTDRAARVQYH